MPSNTCPRLIEVALPIREISAESVRDKSLRHGHISTLHLWWARRPLAASRAVVFASLVPDPDDPNCPDEFKRAVEKYLKTDVPPELRKYYRRRNEVIHDKDPYRPYEGMDDTLRNRLLMFIAKWSSEAIAFESGKSGKEPKPAELLDDRSLVKWETSDPGNPQGREILRVARELIKTAYACLSGRQGGEMPTVLDPFAGGGAIPLEAGRLGCQAIANDYNPVAYLILRATCEFPQKYGKPGKRKMVVQEFGKQVEQEVEVPNVLVHDVEKWATWILEQAKKKIGHLYPAGKDGRPIVGYLWARTAPCSNPSCRGEIPFLKNLLVCNKQDKQVALVMEVDKVRKNVNFSIAKGDKIQRTDGTIQKRGNVICPHCEQVTPAAELRTIGMEGNISERMIAVIVEGTDGKDYRAIEKIDLTSLELAIQLSKTVERPSEKHADANEAGLRVHNYGFKTWGSLFNPRQLVAMQTFVGSLHEALESMKDEIVDVEYRKAVGVYLGLLLSRITQRGSSFGIWNTKGENFEHPFGRQAIQMTWDYPEVNPFSESTGGVVGQLDWMTRVIGHESCGSTAKLITLGDAGALKLEDNSIDVVTTDPPYFDAIAYADLSDYFYIWLKRAFNETNMEDLLTPMTPKSDEATALKHRHEGSEEKADKHFKAKLTQAFTEARRVIKPGGIVAIMFAHQSTKAWSALIHAIFEAGLNIDASWPIDTERTMALKKDTAALETSITVVCRLRIAGSAASFKEVRKEVEKVVAESVKRFWTYGFRGADLIVACYGPAVGVFGKYERVEKADGTPVEIPELLVLAKKAARDAIAGEFRGDNLSTLYYVWANLYGISEQAWDDARLVVQIGGEDESAMEVARKQGIFVLDGAKCRPG